MTSNVPAVRAEIVSDDDVERELLALKQEELRLLQHKLKLKETLPHLYGFPWYSWAWEFFTSRNRFSLLTAGNQLSKSSTQIRKCIDWATDKSKWAELWPNVVGVPNVFWYFYPTIDVATEEFDLKWSLFMPKVDPDDPDFGWTEKRVKGKIYSVTFNTGVTVIFKTYSQKTTDLQTGTIFAIFADEEMPMSHFAEVQARLLASDGYFSMVFTATLGQDYWRKSIEGDGDEELHPEADKWQVTLFDCLKYADGTLSPWTFEKVKRACHRAATLVDSQAAIEACTTLEELVRIVPHLPDPEIQRRIMGKFIFVGGREFEAFDFDRNVIPRHHIPTDWLIYSGTDYGSGGEGGHPSAMLFLAVSPDFRMGRVFRGKRMDGVVTTAKDLLDEYRRVRGKLQVTKQVYDGSAVDFKTYAVRLGESFSAADKKLGAGVTLVNTLFKTAVLKIFDDDPELEKLVTELLTIKKTLARKVGAKKVGDDLADCLRYACMAVPWDWTVFDDVDFSELARMRDPEKPPVKTEIDLRREFVMGEGMGGPYTAEDELNEWDDLLNEFDV